MVSDADKKPKPEAADSTSHAPSPADTPPQGGQGAGVPSGANLPDESTVSGAEKSAPDSSRKVNGEAFDSEEISRSDMVLIQTACNRQYRISEGLYTAVPVILARMILGRDEAGNAVTIADRTKLAAMRLLNMLERTDLERLRTKHLLGLINPEEGEVRLIRTPVAGPSSDDEVGPAGSGPLDIPGGENVDA